MRIKLFITNSIKTGVVGLFGFLQIVPLTRMGQQVDCFSANSYIYTKKMCRNNIHPVCLPRKKVQSVAEAVNSMNIRTPSDFKHESTVGSFLLFVRPSWKVRRAAEAKASGRA